MARAVPAYSIRTAISIALYLAAGAPLWGPDAWAQEAPGLTPMLFEKNRGQTEPAVKYVARGPHWQTFFLGSETVLSFAAAGERRAIHMRLAGGNTTPAILGEGELPAKVSYFIGNDPLQWRAGLPTYSRLRYRDVYPGIDLVFYGNRHRLEHDFRVAPGADPTVIEWVFSGIDRLELTLKGDLLLRAGDLTASLEAPILYQEAKGSRQVVEGSYQLAGPDRVRFRIEDYDPSRPLVIDPVIAYSTYLGGGGTDRGLAPAIDPSGNLYITGTTDSLDFPMLAGPRARNGGGFDVFVTKLSADGSTIVYSTYLGGGGRDQGFGIAAKSDGEVYVSGDTTSNDFPTRGTIQGFGGVQDAFVTKLSSDGTSLVYSTYLGGGATDGALDLRLDSLDQATVSGTTDSDDFPTWRAIQPVRGGARDIFVAKLRADGSGLVFATYLGGSLNENNGAIWLDSAGHVFVSGQTVSTNFPVVNPLQFRHGGGTNDAFVSQIEADGRSLLFSTYLGGSGNDVAFAITVDPDDNVTVTGRTNSTNFPIVNPLQARLAGGDDIFVAKLRRELNGYVFVTYLGGAGDENAFGIVADASGNLHVSGWSDSTNFPTVNAIQIGNAGGEDAVFAEIDPLGTSLVYSTYYGGSGGDRADYIVIDRMGSTYACGRTSSVDFPTRFPMQPRYAGGMFDAFVVKIIP